MTPLSAGYNPGMAKLSAKTTARTETSNEKARAVAAAKAVKSGKRTHDSFQNFSAKLGLGTDNISSGGTYGFAPITRERTLLEWVHRGSWIAGLAVDLIPDDMTRAGVEIKGHTEPTDIEEIEELATSLNIWGSLRDNGAWGRLYGGSVAVMMIKGQDYSTPLRIESIGKGQFKGLLVLDRWMVETSMEDLVTEEGPEMGLPKFYRVTANAPGLRGMRIHHSRCFRAEGNRLPYWQRTTENLWSQSIIERVYDRLVAFDSATTGAAQLVYKSYLRTYSIDGLREAAMEGGDAMDGIVSQVNFMAKFQSVEGITLLDIKDKFEQMQHGAFSGLAEILVHFGQQISGAIQVPLVRLFGQSPVGLNSSGESDIRTYYDNINNLQNKTMKVPVTLIYRAMAQSLGIKLKKGFGIKFRPLWQLQEGEKADIAEKVGRTVGAYVTDGLMSAKTGMMEIQQSASITGIGSNITKEDIAAASDILPPVPEEVAEINAAAKEDTASEEVPEAKAA